MPKEITVTTVKQAKCATAIFTLEEMSKDLLELQSNLKLYCDGTTRVEGSEAGGHAFTYATAEVKALKVLDKANFIVKFLEHKD